MLAGDYNVMPTDLDVYAPKRWIDDALFRPEVRDANSRLVEQGWTDALRALHPGERIYTFSKYFRNAFARDAGLRVDHLLLSPPLAKRLTVAGVDREVRGREHASDHAPAWIELAELHELTAFPKGKHDDQVDSTAQMLDWFKQAGSGPTSNAGIWHLYKQRYEAQQAGASQTERPEPLSVMAKRLGLLRSL